MTVSPFWLDEYEVTVSRFRRYLASLVPNNYPPPEAGANPHVNYEPSSYNAKLGYVYVCSAVSFQPTKVVRGAPSPLGAIAPTFAGEIFRPRATCNTRAEDHPPAAGHPDGSESQQQRQGVAAALLLRHGRRLEVRVEHDRQWARVHRRGQRVLRLRRQDRRGCGRTPPEGRGEYPTGHLRAGGKGTSRGTSISAPPPEQLPARTNRAFSL